MNIYPIQVFFTQESWLPATNHIDMMSLGRPPFSQCLPAKGRRISMGGIKIGNYQYFFCALQRDLLPYLGESSSSVPGQRYSSKRRRGWPSSAPSSMI